MNDERNNKKTFFSWVVDDVRRFVDDGVVDDDERRWRDDEPLATII